MYTDIHACISGIASPPSVRTFRFHKIGSYSRGNKFIDQRVMFGLFSRARAAAIYQLKIYTSEPDAIFKLLYFAEVWLLQFLGESSSCR